VKIVYYTNTGKKRVHNEDGLLVEKEVILESMAEPVMKSGMFSLLAVSDGMGGTKQGEVATKTFLTNLLQMNPLHSDTLEMAIVQTQEDLQGIDTGCATAGIVIGETPFVFNIGDCRVYKKEDIFLNKLTKDHSVVQQLIDSGEIDEEEALVHPRKHVLTAALTSTSKVEPYIKKLSLHTGDIYLICTDGLWGEFGIDELEACFEDSDLSSINENILKAIEHKTLSDNISYILLEI
jgi:serine/threonine protein phosphatase PrpC